MGENYGISNAASVSPTIIDCGFGPGTQENEYLRAREVLLVFLAGLRWGLAGSAVVLRLLSFLT